MQTSKHFPGMVLDYGGQVLEPLSGEVEKFMAELEETLSNLGEPEYFDISPARPTSVVYHKLDLSGRPAIRGQLEGPVSFYFNVKD